MGLNMQYNVLDHGFVRVVDHMGTDASVVQAARVSYGDGTKTPSSDAVLINYLMRHKHTSPFEMCMLKVHVKAPLFVARQWLRHRTASVNELSGRYSEIRTEYYVPSPADYRSQHGKAAVPEPNTNMAHNFTGVCQRLAGSNSVVYDGLLDMQVARELARINLTQNVYTEFYWLINLHNLLHFIELRIADNAQLEIRKYAEVLLDIVQQLWPVTHAAFLEYRLNAFTLSAKMLEVLRAVVNGKPLPQCGLTQREYSDLVAALKG